MSKLYIRVRTGFYTHRKTARLRAVIGDDAFWIPPRLWAYCAENQPDGDLSGYQNPEIAELLGCPKYASSILQALLDAGFLDDSGKIHGWDEHNGYHETYSKRAKTAAIARWSKEKPPAPPKEDERNRIQDTGDKHCIKHPEALLVASDSGGAMAPKVDDAMAWLANSKALGSDYTEAETRGAWLALTAGGWQWGKRAVADWRAALERQIQTDRTKTNHGNNSKNNQRPDRSIGTLNEGTASQYRGIKSRG